MLREVAIMAAALVGSAALGAAVAMLRLIGGAA